MKPLNKKYIVEKIATISIAILTVFLFSSNSSKISTWTLNKERTNLGFTISGLIISDILVHFNKFEGKFSSSKDDFSDAEAEIITNVNSIKTKDGERDEEMKGPDFFYAAKYPIIKFKSKSFKKVNNKNYKLTGDMTMHGVTRRVELDAVCNVFKNLISKKTIAGFKITGIIRRGDFGMNSNSISSTLVNNNISMFANMEFEKN